MSEATPETTTPEKKSFESLYLVSEEDLEKINRVEKPFLSYSQIYNSVIEAGRESGKKKLAITEWLTISDHGKGVEEGIV